MTTETENQNTQPQPEQVEQPEQKQELPAYLDYHRAVKENPLDHNTQIRGRVRRTPE